MQLNVGISSGLDGIPANINKLGGEEIVKYLHKLCVNIWKEDMVPKDFKNAVVISIYKH